MTMAPVIADREVSFGFRAGAANQENNTMKRFLLPLTLLIAVLWAALQPADILGFSAAFLPMRKAYTNLLGALALGWMGFCMLLALRPAWLERTLGGLDKLYFVHKWSGIGAVLLLAAHWLLVLSPRTLVAWGWIERAVRPPRQPGAFDALFGLGKELGEWSAWAMIVLGILSLLKFVPYGWFRKLHKGFPAAFLIGSAHTAIMLLREKTLATPFGALMLIICVLGSVIAVYSLIGLIGSKRRFFGRVKSAVTTEAGVLDLRIDPGADWPGHAPGQFVLLTLDRDEGPHPFSIVSDWKPGAQLRFAIKPLGDYTRSLPGQVRAGDAVSIEGPYGRFDFGDGAEDQVWVAGGVGVAPFLARLEMLAANGGARGNVHLFYCARNAHDASFPAGLENLCRKAGVQLHLRVTGQEGRFSHTEIGQFVRKARSVWFCGPTAWGSKLKAVLERDFGLSAQRFHRELFEFR